MFILDSKATWPRRGLPFLPAVLRRAWSQERLPSAVIERVGLPEGTTLGHLDESIWDEATKPDRLALLAGHVTRVVTEKLYHG